MRRGRGGEHSGKRRTILNIAFIVLIVLIIVSAWQIARILTDEHDSEKLYESLREEYATGASDTDRTDRQGTERAEESTAGDESARSAFSFRKIDFERLQEKYPQIVGWIYQENGEQIDYPILFSGDNDTYLRHLPDGSGGTAGSIFLEEKNRPDFQDSHTIIYGHNMRNQSMFGSLKKYQEQSYYDSHRYFQLLTHGGNYRYEVFSCEVVSADSEIYTVPYEPGDDFADFIGLLRANSLLVSDVKLNTRDKILTLSTCTSDNNRFVVHAVRMEE